MKTDHYVTLMLFTLCNPNQHVPFSSEHLGKDLQVQFIASLGQQSCTFDYLQVFVSSI